MHEDVVVATAGVVLAGVVAQWLGWRLRIPAIVLLLATGLVAGPLTGWLDPDEVFGELLLPAVSMGVAVILFEGALGLGSRGVRKAGRTLWILLTVGAAVTIVMTTVAAEVVLDVDWELALLLATVLVVTGPTVIGPLVRTIGLRGRVGALLEAEGTLIDPIGAVLAVLVFETLLVEGSGMGVIERLTVTLLAGAVTGLVGAGVLAVALSRFLVPDQLVNVATLAAVLTVFAVGNALADEAGLVATTAMGIALASQRRVAVEQILEFNETLRTLLISTLFILLGARIQADTIGQLGWRNLVFLAIVVVVIRPVAAGLSMLRSPLTRPERTMVMATAPRGIVAAAVASVFSLRLAELEVANSQVLVSATFAVIAGTVLVSGLGAGPMARRLGLAHRDRRTIVVLGSNPVARMLAEAALAQDAPVRMIDLDRRQLGAARMAGVWTHRGSVLDERTWEAVDVGEAAAFLAVTTNDELNALAARHALSSLGRRSVFQVVPSRAEHRRWWDQPAGTFARPLFGRDASVLALQERLEAGWTVHSSRLTDRFTPDAYQAKNPDAVVLFVVDAGGTLYPRAADHQRRLRVGETVVALLPPSPGHNGGDLPPAT